VSAPPAAVRIVFSEPVLPVAGGIVVRAPSGRRVDRGPAVARGAELTVPLDAAEEGTYQVIWRVVADDTHPARGSFVFSVARASSTALPGDSVVAPGVAPISLALQSFARWLHLLGYVLAFGPLAVATLVRHRSLRDASRHPARSEGSALARAVDKPDAIPWAVRLAGGGLVLMLLAAPLAVAAQSYALAPESPFDLDVLADAVSSTFGRAVSLRVAAALLLWTLLGVAPGGPAPVLLGLVLAGADAASAHPSSFRPYGLGIGVTAAHQAAMALWLGAVIVHLRAPSRSARRVALAALAVLSLSGAALALVHVPSFGALLASAYGQALLVKLAALAGALAFAARAARRGELGLLLLVVAAAAVLVSLPPPR
jgi:copper transport protein